MKIGIISYCRLCCENYFTYKGGITNLGRGLRKKLRKNSRWFQKPLMKNRIPRKEVDDFQEVVDPLSGLNSSKNA